MELLVGGSVINRAYPYPSSFVTNNTFSKVQEEKEKEEKGIAKLPKGQLSNQLRAKSRKTAYNLLSWHNQLVVMVFGKEL